jgi:3-phenylpropionate/trans-cinnamate dioxygenase ferredoxin reductase component
MKQVVIIGNGVSGITAARHIRKLSKNTITVISSETPYFYSRTALMYVYMGQLKFEHTKPYEDWFWKKNDINLVFDHVVKIDAHNKTLSLRSGRTVKFDDLIIASGSRSNFLGIEGEDVKGVQALYSYQDLETMEINTRRIGKAVVIGGGLIGVEMAEMLHTRKIPVTILVREPAFWNNVLPLPEAQMISRHISSHGIQLLHNQELKEIISEGGKLLGVRTNDGTEIACDFAGIAIGVHPNVAWLNGSGIAVKRGILVNEYLETNVPGIFAIGDCVERTYPLPGRKNIEQVWYTARMMGEVVAQTVCGERCKYEPGPWFNSAKFFDIEYQTYGNVPNVIEEDQGDFYWEHPSGKKALHLVWNKNDDIFTGINSFGIRLRHEKFDRWLRERRSVHYVVDHLPEANFEPEFSPRFENIIRSDFKEQVAVTALL